MLFRKKHWQKALLIKVLSKALLTKVLSKLKMLFRKKHWLTF
jgi:hypothetical protein